MLIYEFKIKAKPNQYTAIDESIRTGQFIQNKCLRYWMDNAKVGKYDLNKYCTVLASKFSFANELNSMARQASAERTWSAISRFYDNCKKKIPGKKGYPQFKKNCRSVEYKTSGWKLSDDRKRITFTDGKKVGTVKLLGTRNLNFYQPNQIKRVRLIKRADGYYCQFCISVDVVIESEPTQKTIGLDVGLESFYTDSTGHSEPNPRFYRKAESKIKKSQRAVSKKVKGSKNRGKARVRLGKTHLKISRQRKDHAVKLARYVILSNDVVVYEDLRVKNLVRNHCLAKSINDAGWYQFRTWLEYLGKKHGKVTIAVAPHYTSQACSECGVAVKKSLSTRTHRCKCGCELHRDHNAAINILKLGLSTQGHCGIYALEDLTSTVAGEILSQQVESLNKEFHSL